MYLTRFRVNTARMGARRLLGSPQVLHAAVMSSFADRVSPHPGEGPRVLWRVDHDSRHEVLLYIVSPDRPDLTHLVEQAGWPSTPGGWKTASYTPFLTRLASGETWAFRLTANPVHSIRRVANEPTKRTAHVTARHQLEWLAKRQEQLGFSILESPLGVGVKAGASGGRGDHATDGTTAAGRAPVGGATDGDGSEQKEYEVVVHNRRDLAFGKSDESSGKRLDVKLVRVTYDGRLRVTDPDALRRTLTSGVGKAKAYGCGLMTLAPLEQV